MAQVVQHRSAQGRLTTPLVLLLTLAAAIGTSVTYPLLPAVSDVAQALGTSVSAVGVALGAGPFGYLCGLGLVVPLVDRLNPKQVLAGVFGVLAAALVLTSLVASAWQLALTGVIVGAMSAAGAALSSLVGRWAAPNRRATQLGILTAGISGGIIMGRLVGGWLTDLLGWRDMVLVFALACLALAVVLTICVPTGRATAAGSYWQMLARIPCVYRLSLLRLAAARGACWFLAFCAMWAGIAVSLSQPPFRYSAEHIGWYAAAGLLGIPATNLAGRLTDRIRARCPRRWTGAVAGRTAVAGVAAAQSAAHGHLSGPV